MHFLEPYHTKIPGGGFSFTRLQASRFAKLVADDYNTIHDVEAKRFCVPGDLLFALILVRLGLRRSMTFVFSGMVNDGVDLSVHEPEAEKLVIQDGRGKDYLHATWHGEASRDPELLEQVIRNYVRFSGHNFPHILQPLMASHQVMINPDRPLVIYESMSIHLNRLDIHAPVVELSGSTLEVVGKRGNVTLNFRFLEGGEEVGTGEKRMVMSGLVPYDQAVMDHLIHLYDVRKRDKVE